MVVNYATSKSGADAVVDRIEKKGGKALAVQADVSKPEELRACFEKIGSTFGRLDILVNNAGKFEFLPLGAITAEHFHKLFDLNVLGLILTTQEAVKLMGRGASVLNISSIVGPMPAPNGSVYSATKAAVDAITIALSKELGPRKIRVNSLNPGMVETEGVHSAGLAASDFQKMMESHDSARPHCTARGYCQGRGVFCFRRLRMGHRTDADCGRRPTTVREKPSTASSIQKR